MSSSAPLTTLSLPSLERIASGKVRDLFALPDDPTSLLFVATDRISAYDVILQNGIPNKGAVLTLLSQFWFGLLAERRLALALYTAAAEYALARGVIIADTKFEFGLDEATDDIVLVDETLTPDSSRFWPADRYEVGREQESFDKQFVRDWLVSRGLKGVDGVAVPDDVAARTADKYREIFEKLTGEPFEAAVARVGAA
ncbi:hypothetical protein VdG2_02131 [Verticillium dahliae VDG2]|nr:hypothetical protein VdG2_02131 [Verticillium dahliae VDG2]